MKGNLLVILAVVGLLLCIGACERWKWQECRAVGHSWFYCATKAAQ